MAKTLTAETLEELTAAYMELPWLDEIRLSQGQVYSVAIIPSDDVSMDEKLLTLVDASTKAHRVPALLQEIAATLGCEQPITAQRACWRCSLHLTPSRWPFAVDSDP